MSGWSIYSRPDVYEFGFGRSVFREVRFLKRCFQRFSVPEMKKVLDVGRGSGVLARALGEAGFEVMGVDSSPEMVQWCNERIAGENAELCIQEGDMRQMFPDAAYDAAICMGGKIHHLVRDVEILQDMAGV